MSNQVFPTFAALDIVIRRSPIYATKVVTSESGKEQRASWQATPRYRYQLTINALRQDQAGDEVATLLTFLDTHKGQWDSFLFNDPYDGVQRRARFESDALELERLVSRVWTSATITLISVK